MSTSQQLQNAVDVAQAAELTGLSKKALRRRLERGTLQSVKVGGKRMIPISELREHDLLDASATSTALHAVPKPAPEKPASAEPAPEAAQPAPAAAEPAPAAAPPASQHSEPAPVAGPVPATAPPAAGPPAAVSPPNRSRSPSEAPAAPFQGLAPPNPVPGWSSPTVDTPGYAPGAPVPGPGGTTPTAEQPYPMQEVATAAPAGGVPPPAEPYYATGRAGGHPPRGGWYYWYEYPAIRWLAVILVVGLIALVVWLLAVRSDGSEPAAVVQPGGGPVGATEEQLVELSQQLSQPVYWAGTMPGTRMELTESNNSYAYLRYLTEDAPVGDPSPDFLTVGTYPALNAYKNLQDYAKHSRADTSRIANGGLVVTVPGSPTSVYLAYPHEDVQVEVYDPEPRHALDLVKSGVVRPVTSSSSAATTTPEAPAVSPTTVPSPPEGAPTIAPQG